MPQSHKMDIKKNTKVKGDRSKYFFDRFRNVELKNFTLQEFACKCESCQEKGNTGEKMEMDFLIRLDKARTEAGVPFKISSGYRCPEHNKKVGGAMNSSHMNTPCNAADIYIKDSGKRYKVLESLYKVGFTRIGVGETFIHCDTDKLKSQRICWTYY